MIVTVPKNRTPFELAESGLYDRELTTPDRYLRFSRVSKSANAYNLTTVSTILLREFLTTAILLETCHCCSGESGICVFAMIPWWTGFSGDVGAAPQARDRSRPKRGGGFRVAPTS